MSSWLNRWLKKPADSNSKGSQRSSDGIRRISSAAHQNLNDQSTLASTTSGAKNNDGTTEPVPTTLVAGLRFQVVEIETLEDVAAILFAKVINKEVNLGPHLFSKIAVAKLTATGKEFIIFAVRDKASSDEIKGVIEHMATKGYVPANAESLPQGYFTSSAQVMSLSQGHADSESMESVRKVLSNPENNSLFATFKAAIEWGYLNDADDVDWVLDLNSDEGMSHIAYKISGRWIKPALWRMTSETMHQVLGIVWQYSGGGASGKFDERVEQQCNVRLDLATSHKVPKGARLRIRWSGMPNERGTTITMRLQRLGDSSKVRSLNQAGYEAWHLAAFERVLNSEGGVTIFSGTVGSGKSTSLVALINMLPPFLKIVSVEDPVELELRHPMAHQKTVTRDPTATGPDPGFLAASRAIFRSALDALYLGEIRDVETGLMARAISESGHSVFTTIHASSALGTIARMSSPAIGIPRDALAAPGVLKLLVYQALLSTNCPHCCQSPDEYADTRAFSGQRLADHQEYWARIERLYGIERNRYRMHNEAGCEHCRREEVPELNGFKGRTVVCEMVEPNDPHMLELILAGKSMELERYWRSKASQRYDDPDMTGKTAMECAIYKASQGMLDPREIEHRFHDFRTEEKNRHIVASEREKHSVAIHALPTVTSRRVGT